MTHLSVALRDFADGQGRAAAVRAPDADLEARLIVSRVRRRKLTRVSTVAASVVAVLALGAVTVYGATRPEPLPPVESPEPAPVQSSTPSPTASPTAEADTGVTLHPLLPAALPLEPGMLAAAPPGSSLVSFQATCGYPCAHPTTPRVLYLVTPDGQYFEARIEDLDSLSLVDWLPGSPVALFSRVNRDYSIEQLVIDLESGEVVGGPFAAGDEYNPGQAWLGASDDLYLVVPAAEWGERSELRRVSYAGAVLASAQVAGQPELTWNTDRSMVLENRSSGPVVFRAPSLEAVALMPLLAGSETSVASCDGIGWFSETEVLFDCTEMNAPEVAGQGYAMADRCYWIVAPSGTAKRLGFQEARETMPLWEIWRLGDRVVGVDRWTGVGAQAESSLIEITRSGRFAPLGRDASSLTIHGSVRDGLVASVRTPDGWYSLQLIDPFTGASSPLLGPGDERQLPQMQVITYSDQG